MAVHGGNIDEISRKYKINTENILDFSANINPLGINKKVKESMIAALDKVERYPDITYLDLKQCISNYEHIKINNIFIGNGAAEVIFNIARAIKPDKILLPAPTFSEYEEAVRSVDSKIKYYKLKEENRFYLDENFLKEIDEDIDLIFICNPNNPTGVLTKKNFVEGVLKKAEEVNAFVVIDESFLDFVEDEAYYSSKDLLGKYKNLIIVKSLTKFFAMPGIRIGYGISYNEEIIEKINRVSVPWAVNIVAAEATCTALKEEVYIKESIEYVKAQRDYLYKELKKLEFIKVFQPSVNFIMFKVLNNVDLKEQLIKYGILIRNCGNYEGLSEEFYRVAVRTQEENIKLITIMKTVLIDKC